MSNFIKINLKLINYQKIKNIYTYNIKKYKIWVPELKLGPNPNPDRLHLGRVRSLQYPNPARSFAIPTYNV